MTLSRPAARIEVDGQSWTTAEGAVVRVRVVATTGAAHDRAEIVCWPDSDLASTAPGAAMTVSIGEPDDETAVWTGELVGRSDGPDGVTLEGLASTIQLSRTRVSRSFQEQTVADIVRDLAADIDIDQVEADLQLNAYHVDDRRTVWDHIVELAELAGGELGWAAEGGLRLVPPRTGTPDVTLRHGADLLAWRVGPAAERPPAAVAAHGAGSEAGTWHWIRRDVGAGEDPLRVVGGFATRDAADQLTESLAQRSRDGGRRGVIAVVGRPGIRPGDRVELESLPGEDPGVLRVRSVDHRLDTWSGFVTALRVAGGES
jgi:hypothetical protein